jgi:predicted dithiol-disulfide oxidoreductase (DUF899 family)
MNPVQSSAVQPKVVSREEWLRARIQLLAKEKELTRLRDEQARLRRSLPWVKIEKEYVFEGASGKRKLADLFDGSSQLAIYHFMFGPDWKEGCPSCSFVSDHLSGAVPHLKARDVTLTMVSRAPWSKLEQFRKRMGWQFPWVSSHGNDFNRDFHVTFTPEEIEKGKAEYNYTTGPFPSVEAPGLSVFVQGAGGQIFHTYSAFARGLEPLVSAYMLLDMTPKGRDEDHLRFPMEWLRHHDRYGETTQPFADAQKPYWPAIASEATGSCCEHGGERS